MPSTNNCNSSLIINRFYFVAFFLDEGTKTLVMPLKNGTQKDLKLGPDISNTRHAVEKRHPEVFKTGSRLSSG